MAIRQPVSVPGPTLDTLRAIRTVQGGGTYGEVIDRALAALLEADKPLGDKVRRVLEAMAA